MKATDHKAVKRLLQAVETLDQLCEPKFGGSVIGGSRTSNHVDSGRHPDPRGAPWRARRDIAMRRINHAAADLERMVYGAEDAAAGDGAWRCDNCKSPRLSPSWAMFCSRCGTPKAVAQSAVSKHAPSKKSAKSRA